MGWFGSRRHVRWRYMRVSWDTWQEVEEYEQITGGSDEESFFTSLKEGGSLEYVGEAPSNVDMVRTYYEFTDDDGNQVSEPVCTQLVETSSETIGWNGVRHGAVSTFSVLKVAEDRLPGLPLTVSAKTPAVEMAASLLNGLGLRTTSFESEYELANDHTFKPDDSYLTIVNWLLSAAGFASASPDARGTVILKKYEDATSRTPAFTFTDGEDSIMYPELDDENDYGSTPNVVRLFSEDEYGGYWVTMRNVDDGSRASLENRGGRELTLYDEITQLKPEYSEDDSEQEAERKAIDRLHALEAMAYEKLRDNSAEIEYVTISNGYYPLKQGDSVEIIYRDMRWQGTVTNITRDHTTESRCQTKIRRYVSKDIEHTFESGVIRDVELG